MPHVNISMYSGRDDSTKKDIARKIQAFLSKELGMEDKYVSVSIEDVLPENWEERMKALKKEDIIIPPFLPEK